jgi:hypothetical protein
MNGEPTNKDIFYSPKIFNKSSLCKEYMWQLFLTPGRKKFGMDLKKYMNYSNKGSGTLAGYVIYFALFFVD